VYGLWKPICGDIYGGARKFVARSLKLCGWSPNLRSVLKFEAVCPLVTLFH
jgi:hypothetical protein